MKKIFFLAFILVASSLFAQTTQIGKWEKDEFTTEWTAHTWNFDVASFAKGSNAITFTYTSGAHRLCIKDVNVIADGKTVCTDSVELSAGTSPKCAIYAFNLSAAPKKIKLTANVRTSGGTNSNGTITGGAYEPEPSVEANSEAWKSKDFTTNWKDYYWNFDASSFAKGENSITFLYTGGSHKLTLTDVSIVADGKTVFTDNTIVSAGTSPKSFTFSFTLTKAPKKLTLNAKARTVGGTDSKGKIYLNGIYIIDEGTTEIKGSAYYGNEGLKKIVIPSTVTKIGSLAFHSCSNLTEIDIPGSVTTIDNAVFQNCTSLSKVTLHEGLTNISYRMFKNAAVEEITIPSSVTSIGSEAFRDCNSLRQINLTTNITEWGKNAFLTENPITLNFTDTGERAIIVGTTCYTTENSKMAEIASALGIKTVLTSQFLELQTAETIADGQYKDYTMIEKISLGTYLTSIGNDAFPSSLKTLRNYNNPYVDEWAKSHGWYLSKVSETYREYSKDKNNELQRTSSMTEGDEYWSDQCYRFDDSKFIPSYTERDTIDRLYGYKTKYYYTNNEEKHDYERWAAVHNSYLAKTEDNLLMLINVGDSILVEYYTPQFEKLETKHIPLEIPMFGTFLASEDGYYYVVEGQYNPDEIEDLEVVRVIKYDKNWNHIKSLSIYGSNTTCPFAFSQATMLENDNHLYIRTGHTMYRDSEGISHQANMFIDVDKNDMSLVYKQTGLGSSYVQYVSHSLDQLQTTKNGFYAGLDLGDAFPRAVVIGKNKQPMNKMEPGSIYTTKIVNNMPQYPRIGTDSYLGVCVGGFASSETHFLTVYAMDDTAWSELIRYPSRNIYITATPDLPDGFGENVHRKVTDYPVETYSARNPYLVKYGKNDFLLLWSRHNKVYYTHVNGDGSFGEQYSFEGHLSSCAPILYNGYIIWYVTDGKSIFFNQIDLQDISKHETIETEGNGYQYLKEIVLIGMPETDFRPYGTAFEDFYPRVESVIIDGSVKNINKGAFLGSSTLTNLVLEDGVESIMYAAFYDCDIRELDIPCSVTSIARDAFNFNKNLTKVTFCDGLQSLGIEAFRNCDLREVTIPKNVFWVDIEAFMNNPNLSKVVIEDGVQRLYDKCFAECAENLEIYVPSSVTIFGENITDPTATWVVVKGSEAHKYAVKNNYKIRFMSPDDNITAITDTEAQNLNIYAIDHTIVVENATDEIFVYDSIGRLIARRDAMHCVSTINVKDSGVYVIKIGNLAKKIFVD